MSNVVFICLGVVLLANLTVIVMLIRMRKIYREVIETNKELIQISNGFNAIFHGHGPN